MKNYDMIYSGDLILVNAEYPLRDKTAAELAPAIPEYPDILLNRAAGERLRQALDSINAGSRIVPVSGYRSTREQASIYESSLKENGAEFTRKYVALPGHSEHQTGLAIDLALNSGSIDFIRPDFPYSGICEDFRQAAPEFGFIERYPAGKEKITGIAHEPWHFRYVGFPHSMIIVQNKLTLEEYTEYIKFFRKSCPLYYSKGDLTAEIFYAPAAETTIGSENSRLSGNNKDGFIITQWREAHA